MGAQDIIQSGSFKLNKVLKAHCYEVCTFLSGDKYGSVTVVGFEFEGHDNFRVTLNPDDKVPTVGQKFVLTLTEE